ncbi:MAG: alpha/beta hydrolase, partial [Proteobacteria bacterium]|nr:alpha/beta hydrolase [Pseudomonadota bacterium]
MTKIRETKPHITPYDKLSFDAETLTGMLASGAAQAVLTDFFGSALYQELTGLAQEVAKTRTRGGKRVYVLPGIMGSQLGLMRARPKPPDVLWVDPIDIAFGRLTKLTLTERSAVVSLGVLLYGYIKLQLKLQRAGFDPVLWDYDWRRSIDDSGRRLAAQLREDPAREILLVAHSMGGLVARHALTLPGQTKVTRVVLLGTPNFGSLAAVQALRGTYSVVRKVAMLDWKHSAEQLAEQVFGSFASLYHLLPPAGRAGPINLFA